MAKPKPSGLPRELPLAGFGAPFAEFAFAARSFLAHARQSAASMETSVSRHVIDGRELAIPTPAALFAAQRDSAAVQVFAAMAVEAAINTYGVIHFGHDQFEDLYGFGKLRAKLTRLLRDSLGKELPESVGDQLDSLTGKRNALVHSRPDEMSPDQDGVMRMRRARMQRRADLAAAVESVEEMAAIVRWLAELDFQAYPMLQEWPAGLIGTPPL